MILLAAVAASACLAVEGEQIRAADLARAVPGFAALAPDVALGYSPAPGARRTLVAGELARLAAQHGLKLAAPAGICVERAAQPLRADRVLAALESAVGDKAARIELLDFTHYPVPPGVIEFPRSGFTPPPAAAAPVIWRGRLRYAENRSLPLWARVRISVPGKRMVAVEDLPAGRPIQVSQVRIEDALLPPFSEASVASLEQAAARAPRRSIRAGAPVQAGLLAALPDVARGDAVTVAVSSGAAQISFRARAETAGRTGDLILLRNPENGRRFQGRVESQGKVSIDVKQHPAVDAAVSGGARRPSR